MFFPVPPRPEPTAGSAVQPPRATAHAPEPPPDPPAGAGPTADPAVPVREPEVLPPGWTAERVLTYVAGRIDAGATRAEIAEALVREGFTSDGAAGSVAAAATTRRAALHAAGRRNMRHGAMWFGGGVLVTGLTYAAAEGGGFFLLAWGAILGGMVQFFRGTTQRAA
jgi:hypothetical protein